MHNYPNPSPLGNAVQNAVSQRVASGNKEPSIFDQNPPGKNVDKYCNKKVGHN